MEDKNIRSAILKLASKNPIYEIHLESLSHELDVPIKRVQENADYLVKGEKLEAICELGNARPLEYEITSDGIAWLDAESAAQSSKGPSVQIHGGIHADQVHVGNRGTQIQHKTVGKGETPRQFFLEIRQWIEQSDLPDNIKAALIEDVNILEYGPLDRMAAAQKTENILNHVPSLREKFKDFVLGVGSSLTATGAWEYGDEILAGIRFFLDI